MKKTGVFCVALAGLLMASAITISMRGLMNPAYAVPTPCGEVDTGGAVPGGGSGGSGGGSGNGGGGGNDGHDIVVTSPNGRGVVDVGIGVTVYDLKPEMTVLGDTTYTINQKTTQLDIDYKAMTCIQIYDNGVLIGAFELDPSVNQQNIKPTFDLTTVGLHNVTVVGYDLDGNPMAVNLEYEITYDPNYAAPPTGVVKIGELTVAKVDLITIVSSVVVACGIFALLVVMRNRKREQGSARRR